jgi:hypothetical protein
MSAVVSSSSSSSSIAGAGVPSVESRMAGLGQHE